jgi:Fic family protein
VEALLSWHEVASGSAAGLRSVDVTGPAPPPPAPAAFVASRLEMLEQWLSEGSVSELRPAGRGALVLARLLEIRPFEEANGRVARLAASHVMEAAGSEPPILVAGDAPRIEAALQRAFQLDTEPLVELLDEAAERSLDVQLQALANDPGAP